MRDQEFCHHVKQFEDRRERMSEYLGKGQPVSPDPGDVRRLMEWRPDRFIGGEFMRATRLIVAVCAVATFGSVVQAADRNGQTVFADVAKSAGVNFTHYSPLTAERHLHLFMGSGVGWLDYDQDGWSDLFFCQGAAWPARSERDVAHSNQMFRNRGGTFQNVTERCGLINFEYSMGVAVGDFNNDGFPDVYTSSFGPDSLYQNNGDGTFIEVTGQTVLNDKRFSASCTWSDIDGDGDLDLYVTNYLKIDPAKYPLCSHVENGKRYPGGCHPHYQPHESDLLIGNSGDGTFSDQTQAAGLLAETPRAGLGVVSGDFDEDGDQDFYIANDTVNNQLWVNSGKGTFTDEAVPMGVAVNGLGVAGAGMGLAAGDVDGDGRTDLFVTNYFNETNTLYRNDRVAFTDVTAEYALAAPSRQRLGFGTSLIEIDNDGWLDLFVANGHVQSYPPELEKRTPFAQLPQLFRNQAGTRFQEVSSRSGPYFTKPIVGRSSALCDFDRDGHQDMAVLHLNGPAALLKNSGAGGSVSTGLRLVGLKGNRDAIGARVEARIGDRTLVRIVQGSQGYLSTDDRQVFVGLGSARQIDTVTIRWPSGRKESWSAIPAGLIRTLREGTGDAR